MVKPPEIIVGKYFRRCSMLLGAQRTHDSGRAVAANGQLGERKAARNALRELLAIRTDFAVVAREELGKWWQPELVEHLMDGLHNAGLEIASE
jgi:hypothetical protein